VPNATGTDTASALAWIRERLGFTEGTNGEKKSVDGKAKQRRIPELRFASPNELKIVNERRGFG
jgi:hypothetical protein